MKIFPHTHDLTCALGELARAATNYPRGRMSTLYPIPRDLVVSAVGFAIQLAIDEGGKDPAEMRALERVLIDKLEVESLVESQQGKMP